MKPSVTKHNQVQDFFFSIGDHKSEKYLRNSEKDIEREKLTGPQEKKKKKNIVLF